MRFQTRGEGKGTPYSGLYGDAPPERGTFFSLQPYTAISGKVVLQRGNAYATMPKVIMGNGCFTVAWLKLKVL